MTFVADGMKVGGDADFTDSDLIAFSNGVQVGGDGIFTNCTSMISLGENNSFGRNLILKGCTALKTFPKNITVGGTITLPDGQVAKTVADARSWFQGKSPEPVL